VPLTQIPIPIPIPRGRDLTRVSQPIKTADDLEEVCTGTYYTDAPEFAGVAPHQVAIADGYMPELLTGDDLCTLRNPDER
jgi:hypothetical protein